VKNWIAEREKTKSAEREQEKQVKQKNQGAELG
jgi:hypothetical protein